MRSFWLAYHPWLAARGFHLFERLPDAQDIGYIFPPPTQCPPVLPYAIYADIQLQTSVQIAPPVSEFDVGNLFLDSSITHAAKVRTRP